MGVRPHTARRPPAWTEGGACGSHPGTRRLLRRGWRGPEPLLWQATARLKDDKRLVVPVPTSSPWRSDAKLLPVTWRNLSVDRIVGRQI